MSVATKVLALNVCTPLKFSLSLVADTSPLVIEKSGKSQGKVREKSGKSQGSLLFIFFGSDDCTLTDSENTSLTDTKSFSYTIYLLLPKHY